MPENVSRNIRSERGKMTQTRVLLSLHRIKLLFLSHIYAGKQQINQRNSKKSIYSDTNQKRYMAFFNQNKLF